MLGAEECEACGYDLTDLSRPESASSFERSFQDKPVRCLRDHPALTVLANQSVRDVLGLLMQRDEGCAVIVDDQGKAIGVFSERDALMQVADEEEDILDRPVGELMTTEPVTVEADAPIAFALHQMDLGGYRHLPCVDEKGIPVSMVSVRDIVTFVGHRFLEGEAPA
ncbi:cyclic nucleotide-binding/CBS domain-containing protein [Kolteria novifilia]